MTKVDDEEFRRLWCSNLSWVEVRKRAGASNDGIAARAVRLGLPKRGDAGYGAGGRRGAALKKAVGEGLRRARALREAKKAGEQADARPVVTADVRAQIDAAIAAGRVTRCPPGWHLGYLPACLGG